MTVFGVHTGVQQTSPAELRGLWRRIEELGFDWISIWDHFYGATGRAEDRDCLEAVTMHTALASRPPRVRCGALVYSIGYRHPAVLAKAITAIDLLSGGRAAIGLGAGGPSSSTTSSASSTRDGTASTSSRRASPCCAGCSTTTSHRSRAGGSRPARRATSPARPRPGSDLGRWPRREAHVAHRRPARRRARTCRSSAPTRSPASATCCCAIATTSAGIRLESSIAVNVGLAWSEASLVRQFGAIAEAVRPACSPALADEAADRVPVRRGGRRPGQPRVAGAVRRRRDRTASARRSGWPDAAARRPRAAGVARPTRTGPRRRPAPTRAPANAAASSAT